MNNIFEESLQFYISQRAINAVSAIETFEKVLRERGTTVLVIERSKPIGAIRSLADVYKLYTDKFK